MCTNAYNNDSSNTSAGHCNGVPEKWTVESVLVHQRVLLSASSGHTEGQNRIHYIDEKHKLHLCKAYSYCHISIHCASIKSVHLAWRHKCTQRETPWVGTQIETSQTQLKCKIAVDRTKTNKERGVFAFAYVPSKNDLWIICVHMNTCIWHRVQYIEHMSTI